MARGAAVRTGFGPVLAEAVPLGAFLHGRCAGRNRCGALTCCGSRDFAYLCPIQPTTLVPLYDVEFLPNPSAADLDALTDLWETSVRATHDFLAPDEICFYRSLVRGGALSAVRLWVVRRPGGGFAAFAGVADGMLEMLFVAPDLRGRGLGRCLVEHAVARCGVRRVDVNEENTQAAGFYARLGFRVVSRDPLDASGRPHPILHLAL